MRMMECLGKGRGDKKNPSGMSNPVLPGHYKGVNKHLSLKINQNETENQCNAVWTIFV
jgi:hypothetical protein